MLEGPIQHSQNHEDLPGLCSIPTLLNSSARALAFMVGDLASVQIVLGSSATIELIWTVRDIPSTP
jgi:hypothetical protein